MAVRLDHLVYAVPDLDAGVDDFARRTGVRPVRGGSHVGRGTANYLVGLGTSYLEIIGPDPEQPGHEGSRPFGVTPDGRPGLATWAVNTDDLDATVAAARRGGFDPGEIVSMSRRTPDGELLEWRLTARADPAGDGIVPFLIDWGRTRHPSASGLPEVELVELSASHPDPDTVDAQLRLIGATLLVTKDDRATLQAVLQTPRGRLEL